MKALLAWLDERTGWRGLGNKFLYHSIPGGAKWRHAWGTALLFAFVVQVITGFFLWTSYSPSAQTAWESVHYIQDEMTGGWLLRGIHHYTAQAFVVLLAAHLFQMVLYGLYRAPREVCFWLLLALPPLAIGMSATGWLLPYDQRGFWASRVPINIAGITPVIGPEIQKLAIGGNEFGHHTLTRFFAFHAGWLPPMLATVLLLHLYLLRRGGKAATDATSEAQKTTYWPDQALRDAALCLGVMLVVLALILVPKLAGLQSAFGVHLGAPADPSEPYSAARPEWFMLFLFQFLKYFPGGTEIWGAMIIPTVIGMFFALMPFLAKTRAGQKFNVAFLLALAAGWGALTYLAVSEDRRDAVYQQGVEDAEWEAGRIKVLARSPAGVPNSGALTLLRNDPLTQGPKLFAKHCASCHRYDGHDGTGKIPKDPQTASDLDGFATRDWIEGFLDPVRIDTTNYFGGTKFKDGKMSRFVKKDIAGYTLAQQAKLKQIIIALSAEAQLKSQLAVEQKEIADVRAGRRWITELGCTDCHAYRKPDPDASAPDLTGYASRRWLLGIIQDPTHPNYYGKKNDRMPAFGASQILSARERELIADWLRSDWYQPPK
ncbi:MAG: cytochrome b N-terminal domain-containing protein [Verrucomicrobia bacterium]|nr:cytochrome b N-terminal domain-containing protein [Verrucomicrobiota bacterium]